jgi:hypothetical protein
MERRGIQSHPISDVVDGRETVGTAGLSDATS